MNGLFLVHKPKGISSRKVGVLLQKKFNLNKVGHVGTLDLEASGLLLVLSNSATRLQNYFLNQEKIYSGEIILGVTSDTDDVYGVCNWLDGRENIRFNKEEVIKKIITKFSPRYAQIPSVVSSKKVSGIASRKLFAQGIVSELEPKVVDLKFNKLEFIDELKLSYEVEVSSGFYVRALARDIGQMLEIGGITNSIHRVSIGNFNLSSALTLNELNKNYEIDDSNITLAFIDLKDLHNCLRLPKIEISGDEVLKAFSLGNKNILPEILNQNQSLLELNEGDFIQVVNEQDKLSGILKYDKLNNELHFSANLMGY